MTSLGVATGLIVGTIVLMWIVRGTILADATVWLYGEAPFAPYPGLIVFGTLLTGGRYYGLAAATAERNGLALLWSGVVAITYAAFGAGVFSLYEQSIHGLAILVTSGITAAITLGAAALVYTPNYSFADWDIYSGILMIIGFLSFMPTAVVGSPVFVWFGFGIILLGWIVDLVFEIYMVSSDARSPLANGIGVYIAFMGVFIHILQLVLEDMAEG